MLPKLEKIPKKISVETKVDPISSEEKTKSKRSLVGALLFSTAFLSLFFWAYRQLSQSQFSLPKLNVSIPSINVPKFTFHLYPALKSVYIYSSDVKVATYLGDSFDPNPIIDRLNVLPPTDSPVKKSLPEGINYYEIKNDEFFAAKINSTGNQVIIILKPNQKISNFENDLPQIVSDYYWKINSN